MDEKRKKLIIGALTHDIGKVLYREAKISNHSDMGYNFLKDEIKISDNDILYQVKYHHGDKIRNANLEKDSFAYITYIADNIASMSDRRKYESSDNVEQPFDRSMPLDTIFNILYKNNGHMHYKKMELKKESVINMPTEDKEVYDEHFYNDIKNELIKSFNSILDENKNIKEKYINSYIACLETWLSYIPSSTYGKELPDISLYDHLKMTAAFAINIYDYLIENNITNYYNELLINKDKFYDKKAFLMLSVDFSGIQDFIYMHGNDDTGMLKSLRVRSFYLEILLENILDELLEELSLSRTNVLYCGGGHGYLLVANTKKNINKINEYIKNINLWLINNFENRLYLSYGYSDCSASDLDGEHTDRYKEVFKNIQSMISKNKLHRYNAEDIKYLNNKAKHEDGRECAMCKKTDKLSEDKNGRYICSTCASIIKMSDNILDEDKKFFIVINENDEKDVVSLPMPFNKKIILANEKEAKERIKDGNVRIYSKNEGWTGEGISTKLLIADYYKEEMPSFKKLSEASYGGYKKLAIFRADVDNLGSTFVSGFPKEYMTISRTATLSRNLSLFFKKYIKDILENPELDYNYIVSKDEREKENKDFIKNNKIDKLNKGRNIAIIYSGGDDIFAVGAWDDIINFAIDLYNKFREFTQGTLTFSCGIGLFDDSFPIYSMAKETGELEDLSKNIPKENGADKGKNAITLFGIPSVTEIEKIKIKNKKGRENEDNSEKEVLNEILFKNTYKFDQFIKNVLEEKYKVIKEYFVNSSDKGRSFLYKLMELVKNSDEKINLARLAYTLARAKPKIEDNEQQNTKNNIVKNEIDDNTYKDFMIKILKWIENEKERKQLLTAIELYGYYSRIKEEK